MTISLVPADDRFRRFVCTGGETGFPVTFPFFAASDLAVVRERGGTETVLALASDYTVAGAGNPAGGTVTLAMPALAGDVIGIRGEQPAARTSEWTDGQALTARALNAEHARQIILHQQTLREVNRGLRLSLTEPAAQLLLPPRNARANRVLGFNAAGEPVAVVPNTGSLVVTPFAETLLDDTSAAEARGTLGIEAAGDARYGRLAVANVWTEPQRVARDLRVDRADFAAEGGRIVSRRAFDNADGYYWQTFGSGSSPAFRLVKAFGTPAQIMTIEDSGAVTLTGPVSLPGAPTAPLHAATKAYVDGIVTTGSVLNATAGASVGAVGTYALAWRVTDGLVNPGDTVAGSDLRYANDGGNGGESGFSTTALPGTWRLMGALTWRNGSSGFVGPHKTSLWLRIA